MQERSERFDVVALESSDIAIEQSRVLLGQPVPILAKAAGCERCSRALKRAVHRGQGCVQAFSDLGGGPADHIGQEQHRTLLRRKVLERGHEGEANALAEHGTFRRISIGGKDTRIGNGLEPVSSWTRLERVFDGALRAHFDRSLSTRAVRERIEANVGRDPIQPGAQGGTPVEPAHASPGADHRFLDGVIGFDH